VLICPAASKRLALLGRPARDLLADYAEAADLVTPLTIPPVVLADPDDDHVIAAAIAAQAEFIVSGDRHLRDLGTWQGIRTVDPGDAIRLVAAL